MQAPAAKTRIQERNIAAILDAGLEVFANHGFRGATLDMIAKTAGLSKPNMLYYFKSKEAIHVALLQGLLATWLDPLRALDPAGDPTQEILGYVDRKLDMARDLPRESRLFANEIVQGAPRILDIIQGPLKTLVDEKAALIRSWSERGLIAVVDPYHLLFSIWATTQHYADFDAQVAGILGAERTNEQSHLEDARGFLRHMFSRALTPR